MLDLWGIGKETAYTILLYGLNRPIFVVDAYTRRLLVDLTHDETWNKKEYDEVRKLLESALSRNPTSSRSKLHSFASTQGRAIQISLIRETQRVSGGRVSGLVDLFQQSHALIVQWGKLRKR